MKNPEKKIINQNKHKPPRYGIILIVSGPSGTGKSTICKKLIQQEKQLSFSVSCTTRKARPDEIDGKDYHFISPEKFANFAEKELFLEYAEVHENYYGTLSSELLEKVKNGLDVLLDIDVQGALQIRKKAENDSFLAKCLEFVFIGPPHFSELEKRLKRRGTESEKVMQTRLNNAQKELKAWNKYDYLIINKDIEKCLADMKNLLDVLHKKTARLKNSGFFDNQ